MKLQTVADRHDIDVAKVYAATARSTGDELVVVDSDFRTAPLEDIMAVTNLRE